jgi:3-hydroxymyristoyl/3-hydroxydecanoyl-(acyl carrier protein) dehydratase
MHPGLEIHFAADHPAGAGHFPSNPIIPGALILDQVIATLPAGATAIRSTKFFHVVRPGESLRVLWTKGSGGAARFECRLSQSGALVASGAVETGDPRA